jgi:hypothetical protein
VDRKKRYGGAGVSKGNKEGKTKRGKPTSESGTLLASALVVVTCDVGTLPSVASRRVQISAGRWLCRLEMEPTNLQAAVVALSSCGQDVKSDIGSVVSSPPVLPGGK